MTTPNKFTRMSDADRAKLSPLRRKAIEILEQNVPITGLTSNDAAFKILTGYNTVDLQAKWKTMPTLTTCNAFGGRYAVLLGAPPGCWLSRGLLQLDWVKKDVPDSWKESSATDGAPKPGDIFAARYVNPTTKEVQKFGHVGVLYCWHDTIFYDTVESGQGGMSMGLDKMQWKADHLYHPSNFTGWVDIEIYINGMAGRTV